MAVTDKNDLKPIQLPHGANVTSVAWGQGASGANVLGLGHEDGTVTMFNYVSAEGAAGRPGWWADVEGYRWGC